MEEFFKKLGFDEKESKVIMAVIRLGSQPTSVIAKFLKIDRTTAYRILKDLYKKGLLSKSTKNGITVFYVEKLSNIEHYIKKGKERYETLGDEFSDLMPQLTAIKSSFQMAPSIQIYDGFEKLQDFYRDIVVRAKEQNLLQIRILGSNTFSQKLEQQNLGNLIENFQSDLKKNKIETDILIAQGNLTREWLTNLQMFEEFANLPAAGGATNVILVGESVFMVSFREFPVGLRIDHPDIAQTMHFLFDVSGKYANVKSQFRK
ncbi:MAG: helix-turn-helix domain-containing protein [Candidatus Gracilibacteria bacterium]|jgi:sugar-specific transcriptional regulator TrmB